MLLIQSNLKILLCNITFNVFVGYIEKFCNQSSSKKESGAKMVFRIIVELMDFYDRKIKKRIIEKCLILLIVSLNDILILGIFHILIIIENVNGTSF